jgi:hypothetical protein
MAMDDANDMMEGMSGWEQARPARPNRKGTLRYNPFGKHYKTEGYMIVDRVQYSLNKKKRWSMVQDFEESVQNGNSTVLVSQRKSRRRKWTASTGPDNVNELVLSFSTGKADDDAVDGMPQSPQQAGKIITTRKGDRVAVKKREKGKRVTGKYEGARAQAASHAPHVDIAVHPCMLQGHYPLMDTQGRTTRPWNKIQHHRPADRSAKKIFADADDE